MLARLGIRPRTNSPEERGDSKETITLSGNACMPFAVTAGPRPSCREETRRQSELKRSTRRYRNEATSVTGTVLYVVTTRVQGERDSPGGYTQTHVPDGGQR